MMDCLIPQKLHQFAMTIEMFLKHCFSRCTHNSGLEREGGANFKLVGIEILGTREGGNAPG